MRIPQPPNSDEEVQRHKFYGAMSSSLDCLSDRIDNDDKLIKENNKSLYDKYGKIKSQMEDIHVRINARVYEDDFNHLKTQVHTLSQQEVAHRTAWATGKTFIFGAWIVFAVLFGWGYSMTQKQLETYVATIDSNEKVITELKSDVKTINNQLLESKIYHKEKTQIIATLIEKTDYLEDTLKKNFSNINSLNNTVKQLETKVNAEKN